MTKTKHTPWSTLKLAGPTLVLATLPFACALQHESDKGEQASGDSIANVSAPLSYFAAVPIPKSYTAKKVYVHIMPWFQTPVGVSVKNYLPPVNPNDGTLIAPGTAYQSSKAQEINKWGQHWTMANKNPNNWVNGRRDIASYYYPLTGPYASGDQYIIEYQLLLMKYSGVDGIIIDDPGKTNLYDFPTNQDNSQAIASLTSAVGLGFAVAYEDRNMLDGNARLPGFNAIGEGQWDMTWYRDNYFNRGNYIRINGNPLLLVFGPLYFQDQNSWSNVLSPLGGNQYLLTLAHLTALPGYNAAGGFTWISSDPGYLPWAYGLGTTKMSSAFPGFNSFYSAGGWGSDSSSGPVTVSVNTFNNTLNAAKNASAGQIQLATWNDYGEGTMIEPTVEFGYGFLTALQSQLGVAQSQSDLELIKALWDQRQAAAGNSTRQSQLDQAFQYLVSRQVAAAAAIINGTSPGPGPGPASGASSKITANGIYEIMSVNSSKCFDVYGAATGNNVNIEQYSCNQSNAQRFQLVDAGGGAYLLKNVGTGGCADVYGASTADNADIVQWGTCSTSDQAQRFYIDDFGNGQKQIRNVRSNKCADVYGGSTADFSVSAAPAADIRQFGCSGSNNQRWIFRGIQGDLRNLAANMCVHPLGGATVPAGNTNAVLWNDCSVMDRIRYTLRNDGNLQHVSSGECLHPLGGVAAAGTPLVFYPACGYPQIAFTQLPNGAFQHKQTGLCLQRQNGTTNNGEPIVFGTSCVPFSLDP